MKDVLIFNRKFILILVSFWCLFVSAVSYALPFTIVPKAGTQLPTTVPVGRSITAYYTVFNNTMELRINNFVKYLPPNVSQVTSGGTFPDTCGATFTLAAQGPASRCTLQLNISGPVNGRDRNPHHHLFVCFPGGISCAGTNFPLNVSQVPFRLVSIAVTPSLVNLHIGETQQYTATGTFNDNSTSEITSQVTWISSNPSVATISSSGLATAINIGTSTITASLNSITSNAATLNVIGNAYITNSGNNTLSFCRVNADASLSNCVVTAGGFSTPFGVAINAANSFAYIANSGNATVSRCEVESNGNLNNCINTGNGFGIPRGIALNSNNTFAYITDALVPDAVNVCSINSITGLLTACVKSGSGFADPIGIAINPSNTFAYIASPIGTTISVCAIDSITGLLSGCASTGNGFADPAGVAINSANTFAYITNTLNNTVSVCSVNSGTGALSGCIITGSNFNVPIGITLNPTNTVAYISNFTGNNVTACVIDNAGTLSNCTIAAIGFNQPVGLDVI